jgi:hypothetical protein
MAIGSKFSTKLVHLAMIEIEDDGRPEIFQD